MLHTRLKLFLVAVALLVAGAALFLTLRGRSDATSAQSLAAHVQAVSAAGVGLTRQQESTARAPRSLDEILSFDPLLSSVVKGVYEPLSWGFVSPGERQQTASISGEMRGSGGR